jgi:biopolymer transport protein ExbD
MARKSYNEKMETPISTLIDVVFLLIIFFVVTAAMDVEVLDKQIELAQAKYAEVPRKIDPRTFFINIRKKGEITVGMGHQVTIRQLQQLMTSLRDDYGTDYPIVIRAHGEVPYGKVKPVMDAVTAAGLYKVKLSAKKEE